jgi:hypothetical protein
MTPTEFHIVDSQLDQVSRNYAIVLEQLNKIPLGRKDEIGALREAVRALMNSSEMHNAVCVAMLREFREEK